MLRLKCFGSIAIITFPLEDRGMIKESRFRLYGSYKNPAHPNLTLQRELSSAI